MLNNDEPAARRQFRETAEELEKSSERLLQLRRTLAVSPREDVMLLGEEDPDFSCEARRVIDCTVADLAPMIQRLREVAEYGMEGA